ncbi:MAG: alpha/beta fold hydrolase [Burkholderiaceae bacterium]
MTETIKVPHLGGSTIGYKFGQAYDASKPTLVLVNSFGTSVDLYRPQFSDDKLAAAVNLLAIELYGHGETRAPVEQYTYWDTAIANLQVLEALNIPAAYVLGTSQGGWVAARMAMLEPARIKGIIPLGTSMDYESQSSRDRGCWDGIEFTTGAIDALAEPVDADWVVAGEFIDGVLGAGLGENVSDSERQFWHTSMQKNYAGDEGRRRLRQCSINLRDRDGLHGRLDGVTCPVLWIHGTDDSVYSVANAEHEIKMFVNSPQASLKIVQGGQHFLSASDPKVVNDATREFITATSK